MATLVALTEDLDGILEEVFGAVVGGPGAGEVGWQRVPCGWVNADGFILISSKVIQSTETLQAVVMNLLIELSRIEGFDYEEAKQASPPPPRPHVAHPTRRLQWIKDAGDLASDPMILADFRTWFTSVFLRRAAAGVLAPWPSSCLAFPGLTWHL